MIACLFFGSSRDCVLHPTPPPPPSAPNNNNKEICQQLSKHTTAAFCCAASKGSVIKTHYSSCRTKRQRYQNTLQQLPHQKAALSKHTTAAAAPKGSVIKTHYSSCRTKRQRCQNTLQQRSVVPHQKAALCAVVYVLSAADDLSSNKLHEECGMAPASFICTDLPPSATGSHRRQVFMTTFPQSNCREISAPLCVCVCV